MNKYFLFVGLLFVFANGQGQKKELDHSVYNSWQSIGERMISNDGQWVVYTIDVQEGDNELVIQSTVDVRDKKTVPRGYNAIITEDSRFVVFAIKHFGAGKLRKNVHPGLFTLLPQPGGETI